MTSWIADAIGAARLRLAEEAASRRRIVAALGLPEGDVDEEEIREIVTALEMVVFDHLATGEPLELRQASVRALSESGWSAPMCVPPRRWPRWLP